MRSRAWLGALAAAASVATSLVLIPWGTDGCVGERWITPLRDHLRLVEVVLELDDITTTNRIQQGDCKVPVRFMSATVNAVEPPFEDGLQPGDVITLVDGDPGWLGDGSSALVFARPTMTEGWPEYEAVLAATPKAGLILGPDSAYNTMELTKRVAKVGGTTDDRRRILVEWAVRRASSQ